MNYDHPNISDTPVIVFVAGVLIFVVIILLVVLAMDIESPISFEPSISTNGYEYIVIDGMPCLVRPDNVYNPYLSCNWDYWEGTVEDGEIVFP